VNVIYGDLTRRINVILIDLKEIND